MAEDKKDKIDDVTIGMTKNEVISRLASMRQNIDRAIRFVELEAPLFILKNETRMIQRRALYAEAYYEEYLEMKNEQPARGTDAEPPVR